jgi:hypothetical protein
MEDSPRSAAESSIGVDYAEPAKSEQEEAFEPEEEDDAVEASAAIEGVAAAAAGRPTTRQSFGLRREKTEGGPTFGFPLSSHAK